MSRSPVLQIMAPSRNKEKFSRMRALLTFEGETNDLGLRIRLEMTKYGKNASDGTIERSQKLSREFLFNVDPLDLGGSALLACAGRKNEVAIYNRGSEMKKITRPAKPPKESEVAGETVVTRRKSETVMAPDTETLWEIQTFQTQRTRRMISGFVRDTCQVIDNLLANIRESNGMVHDRFKNQLENLLHTGGKITNHRESALFEMKMVPISIDEQHTSSEIIKFQLDEVAVMNLVYFCRETANAQYSGSLLFFGGLKAIKRKGKIQIATGTAFESLSDEQIVGVKLALSEFLELGHVPKHAIRGGITMTSPPIVTRSNELVAGRQLLINIRDRIATLGYFEAAKLHVYL